MTKKVMIAMSGGVDSSVAAYLAKQAGYACAGATMKLFSPPTDEAESSCCSLDDAEDAKAVACRLQMPHYVFNFTAEFKSAVMDKFAAAYAQGQTPNPCIDCNRRLKFARLWQRAQELGYDYIATGHYARIEYNETSGRWLLKQAADAAKDQSYVLFSLSQQQLAHTLLPLGGLTKAQVRQTAAEQGFINAHKRESQDICFVPGGDYAQFICRHTGQNYPAGDFIDKQGRVIGRHKGIIYYTIGQRHGLGIALGRPAYVCAVDPAANTVQLGFAEDMYTSRLRLSEINLIALEEIKEPQYFTVKIGYRRQPQPALVRQTAADALEIEFVRPQRAAAPGQAAVIYAGDTVIGGGIIA